LICIFLGAKGMVVLFGLLLLWFGGVIAEEEW